MTPALARMKRGVRLGIDLCSGVDGAAATADRRRSVAGDWHNLNHAAFPPLDCALAIDEVALSQGRRPPIIAAYARELSGVFVRLPDCAADPDTLAGMVLQLTARLGEISSEMAASLSNDGVVDMAEAARLLDLKHEHDAVSAQLGLALETIIARKEPRA